MQCTSYAKLMQNTMQNLCKTLCKTYAKLMQNTMHLCIASILFIYLFVYLYICTVHCTLKAKFFAVRKKQKQISFCRRKTNSQISLLKARYCVFFACRNIFTPPAKKNLLKAVYCVF